MLFAIRLGLLTWLVCYVLGQMAFGATLHSNAGATASVSPEHVKQFQALVHDLEAHGAHITFMGGYRSGHCSQRHKHPCGLALDVCQLSRGIVDRRCHLPSRTEVSAIAERHGLFSGGDWCDSDYGHFEAGSSVACSARGGRYARIHHNRSRIAADDDRSGSLTTPSSNQPDYH